jgi:dienelactone hydrolase
MTAFEISSLQIAGYADLPLPNRFFRNNQPPQKHPKTLAVILPGLNYSCDMPLLFYPAKLMLDWGADVLQVHSDYTTAIYQTATRQDQAVWLATDTRAALRAGQSQDDYRQLVLIGKSIGTLALASLVEGNLDLTAVAIWLTPLLRQTRLLQAATSTRLSGLFVASRSDPTFDADGLERIKTQALAETLLFDGANHSLELPGDVFRSLEIIRQVLQGIQSFLENHLD